MSVPTRPLSPWAQRYGYRVETRLSLFIDDEIHSSLAPYAPSLHPKYYADVPPYEGPPTKASQLDHLFLNEFYQRPAFYGTETWQIGPLMRYVWFSERTGLLSGGHREADSRPPAAGGDERWEDIAARIFESERIQVDETRWFQFLRKDRWYDIHVMQSQPTLYHPDYDHERWSVDNPEVWSILRIILELADRILKALIAERHPMMETILFGLVVPWSEAHPGETEPWEHCSCLFSRAYLDEKLGPDIQNPLNFVTELPSDQWAMRLENLLADRAWGMMDRMFLGRIFHGVTIPELKGMILLNVGFLRALRNPDATLSEKCTIHFFLSNVILHELFHSIHTARQMKDRPDSWSENFPCTYRLPAPTGEPLLDGDGQAELGHAGITRIWGGDIRVINDNLHEFPMSLARMTWPHPRESEPHRAARRMAPVILEHEQFKLGTMVHISPVPALYTAKLLSAAFWDDPNIPQKSLNGFHCNVIFNSDTPWGGNTVDNPPKLLELGQVLPERLDPGEREMIIAWEERRMDWEGRRRGWYEPLKREWELTPWADISARNVLILFPRGFAIRDELECRSLAAVLVHKGYWGPDKERFARRMVTRNGWVYYAIGMLMYAALPIQKNELKDEPYEILYELYPSRHARADLGQIVYSHSKEMYKRSRRTSPSKMWDPLTRPGVTFPDFGQGHYLKLIDILFHFLGINGIEVHTAWYDAIMNMRRSLGVQRNSIQDRSAWATEWTFVAPEYNTNKSRFIDDAWVDVG
ncbi:hypothetical protein GGR51DRAFT_558511 [Nemania sp. FL0031]|nr:hypothetical protein GGR51DRAFT_558511 [Nemania sp. FL0031]